MLNMFVVNRETKSASVMLEPQAQWWQAVDTNSTWLYSAMRASTNNSSASPATLVQDVAFWSVFTACQDSALIAVETEQNGSVSIEGTWVKAILTLGSQKPRGKPSHGDKPPAERSCQGRAVSCTLSTVGLKNVPYA